MNNLYTESDTVVWIKNVINAITGEYDNAATITASLKNASGTELDSFTLEFDASGTYYGIVTPAMLNGIAVGDTVTIDYTINGTGGYTRLATREYKIEVS